MNNSHFRERGRSGAYDQFLPSAPLGPPNAVSDRAAMGYPEFLRPSRTDGLFGRLKKFLSQSDVDLAEIVEDRSESLENRIAAGSALAVIGDLRVQTLEPKMIEIPGLTTVIGLDRSQLDAVVQAFSDLGVERSWIEKEVPAHSVTLLPFRIAKYPVTNVEYRQFLLETGFPELPSSWMFGRYPAEHANHPVYTVGAKAADAYAAWLSRKTSRAFRLPTEAEWEVSCSGGEDREFPWGNTFESDRANTLEEGLLMTSPVGCFPKGFSPYGVADMAGNVEEYVSDEYRAYPNAAKIEDHLADLYPEGYRVARGGSFARFRDLARCRRRHGHYPRRFYCMGFRLAETVTPSFTTAFRPSYRAG